jgi:hypothetical protein
MQGGTLGKREIGTLYRLGARRERVGQMALAAVLTVFVEGHL